ncbi:MAG: hypothetical protein II896_02625 [Clostridia bacterium]|nr:hypothetical protein [Clostridia bacterium]
MKRFFRILLSLALIGSLLCAAVACTTPAEAGVVRLSASTTALNKVNYAASGDATASTDEAFRTKLSDFSAKLYALCAEGAEDDYVFSPLSVYMATAILYNLGDEAIKADIRALFGMSDAEIAKTGDLFMGLINERYEGVGKGTLVTKVDVNNSIWLDNALTTNQTALDRIAEALYCRAYRTPFADDNKQANKDIRAFIKQMTRGLIDQDFGLTADTLLAIVNTLYFKDLWNFDSRDLATETRTFHAPAEDKETEFLIGKYTSGTVQETDSATYFYTTTDAGYRFKLILPKEGRTLAEAMSAQSLAQINATTDYGARKGDVNYETRCIFPSFRVESDTPLKDILEHNHYLPTAFNGFGSDLTDQPLAVSDIKHKVVLNVDKKGVEGAAVTIIAMKNASAGMFDTVRADFVLDRPFGFLVTDREGVVLFSGQIVTP